MTQCKPVEIGAAPGPLTVNLVRGMPAVIAVTPEGGPLPAPVVIEWAAATGGDPVASHTLEPVPGSDAWGVTLSPANVDELSTLGVTYARVTVGWGLAESIELAGRVVWRTGWQGSCPTTTATIRVIAITGPGVHVTISPDFPDDALRIIFPAYMSPAPHVLRLPIGA